LTAPAHIPEIDDRAHPERVTYALVVMPVLFFVGLGIGVGVGVTGDDLIELILALATTVVSLIPLVIDQARRPSERHVLLSTFSIVFIIGFVLPVLVIFIPAEGPIDARRSATRSWSPPTSSAARSQR
jgi:predicted transporter